MTSNSKRSTRFHLYSVCITFLKVNWLGEHDRWKDLPTKDLTVPSQMQYFSVPRARYVYKHISYWPLARPFHCTHHSRNKLQRTCANDHAGKQSHNVHEPFRTTNHKPHIMYEWIWISLCKRSRVLIWLHRWQQRYVPGPITSHK